MVWHSIAHTCQLKLKSAEWMNFALTPNPSPKIGRGEQILQFPESQFLDWGLGDEDNPITLAQPYFYLKLTPMSIAVILRLLCIPM